MRVDNSIKNSCISQNFPEIPEFKISPPFLEHWKKYLGVHIYYNYSINWSKKNICIIWWRWNNYILYSHVWRIFRAGTYMPPCWFFQILWSNSNIYIKDHSKACIYFPGKQFSKLFHLIHRCVTVIKNPNF